MIGELITLPLRATGLAVRLWWRAADQALGLASGAAGRVIERLSPPGSGMSQPSPAAGATGRPAATAPVPVPVPGNEPDDATAEPGPAPEQLPAEPRHVSAQPTLVEEIAEPGAEDGAGAELHIREPWEGYRDMSARDITARLAGASAAELAAVDLFERSNRGRQTILTAIARQQRSRPQGRAPQLTGANGSDSQQ